MMDAKALAKSKRAHSQHHSKKPHSVQKSKPPSPGVNEPSNSKKQTIKQIKEKAHQAQRISALPSNWNRYEEEFDSGSEDPNQTPDVIVPKRFSQLQSNPYSNNIPSLDDVFPGDFNQFVGSMLAVRGEGILSWTGNDNFVVDDSTTATPEASFLSLNLHALAEQLEKVDLSERLFIEEDLLPPDLRSERSKVKNDQEPDQMQAPPDQKEAAKITEGPTPNDLPGSKAIDAILSNSGLDSMAEVQGVSISGQHGESSESRAPNNLNSTTASNKKVPAEAKLDMLLNSFNETKLLDTSDLSSKKSSSIGSLKASNLDSLLDDLLQETSTTVNRGIDSSKTAAVNSTSEDLLDDLLQETSSTIVDAKLGSDNNVRSSSSSSQSVSKSKILNDFDSWLDTI
ncbi:Phosphorelay luxU [Gossypium arboreum]|uniref:Phosphorelay luxU n=1 Tax=Gossypium arboreum TaxID=29729 RepID=A0A0B0MK73_GOSAR|nr:Phosphorelay luxU [Gossypium arboreum]